LVTPGDEGFFLVRIVSRVRNKAPQQDPAPTREEEGFS
jgi:hypothetical protein